MKSLILMLQFFTRLPINVEIDVKEDSFTKGIPWFPLVGLVIGALDALVYAGAARILPVSVAAILAVLCDICVTGALHYDGLADTCDGVFSARSRERMLEIMKDSRIGTNGAIALMADLALKVLLLVQLDTTYAIPVVIGMSVISKLAMSLLIVLSKDHGKESGLGKLFLGTVDPVLLTVSLLSGVLLVWLLLGPSGLLMMGAGLLLMLGYRGFILKRLGVITGDTLGALNELSMVLSLLIAVVLERNVLL